MQVDLWALTREEDFQEALSSVVLEGGDADTNGAVAGAVLGGLQSCGRIPVSWAESVPYRDYLEGLAYQLLLASKRES